MGRKLDRVQHDLLDYSREGLVVGKINAGAPKDLPKIFVEGQRIGVVPRYRARARTDGKCHLDHLVEREFVAGGAEGASIFRLFHRLQCRGRVEHAAAAWTEHVPGKFE